MEVSPEKTFTGSIKINNAFNMTDLSTEMINSENNEVLVAYQPVEQKNRINFRKQLKDLPFRKIFRLSKNYI